MSLFEELTELAERATPGPWEVEVDHRTDFDRTTKAELWYVAGYNITSPTEEIIGCEGIIPGDTAETNAALIVKLRNALPDILAALKERDRLREATLDTLASLVAAIWLLENGSKAAKKAAPSDRMFDQMIVDYKKSVNRARAALEQPK